MRPPFSRAIVGLALCTLFCFVTDAWSQGRKKPHRPSASESVELPDPSPGNVIEAGYQDDVGGAIEHRLGFLINVYAHGMQGYIRDAARGLGGLVSEPSMERFRQQLLRATFAYFEYSWQVAGVRHTRIYVARSNQGFERLIPSGASDLAAPGTTEADYLPDTGVFRFARTQVDVPGSSVHPSHDPLANRANDAELKILQTLKNDIHLNRQMEGGELIGFVTQRPCVSCSPALRRFASETGATVRVNYVDGENAEGRRTPLFQSMRQIREIAAALLVSYFNRPS